MTDAIRDYPFTLVALSFSIIAWLRGQATYAVGRLVSRQGLRLTAGRPGWAGRIGAALDGPRLRRAATTVDRYGMPSISLAYVTVGLQTMVMAAAGVLRMRWWRFTLAQVPGAVAWGLLYATGGLALWAAAVDAALGRAWPFALAASALLLVWWRAGARRRKAARPADALAEPQTEVCR